MLWRTLIGEFPWSPWLKAPRTGTTCTLTWIAHIHAHTLHQHSYNHMVQSASSAIIFQCMLGFLCPPNSDMDYRIFNVHTLIILVCAFIYIHRSWAHWHRVRTTFLTQKNSQIFLVLLTGFKPLAFGSWVRRSTNSATQSFYSAMSLTWQPHGASQ